MLKLVLLGVWVILVTAGATVGSVYLSNSMAQSAAGAGEDQGVDQLKTEMTSVPMIRNGEIIGYVIIQLSFAADRKFLADMKLAPEPYLNDAAFRVLFSSTDVDFRRLKRADIDKITTAIATEANFRIGSNVVRQVLIQQLNFVRKEDIRTNWIGKTNVSN